VRNCRSLSHFYLYCLHLESNCLSKKMMTMMTSLACAMRLLVLLVLIQCAYGFFATISTGEVGVKYRFQEIQQDLSRPGLNFHNPFTSRIERVDVLPQTDTVKDVECGTNDGLKLIFNFVEVGNRLPEAFVLSTVSRFGLNYDKYLVTDLVRHQINVICSKKSAHEIAIDLFDTLDDLLQTFIREENERQTTGLEINFVRLSKPRMPESIQANYLKLAEERTMKMVIEERKARTKAEKEAELLVATKDAEIALSKAQADNNKMILNMRAKQDEERIKNEMVIEQAAASAKQIRQEAEAMEYMYKLPRYAEIRIAEALSKNQKIYYGDKLSGIGYPLFSANAGLMTETGIPTEMNE
jgi:regulator of protease activity HflC (stomatin/prohibitin superfamily)